MIIASTLENKDYEKRISITPEIAKKYIKSGFKVLVEDGLGSHLNISNDEFSKEGCTIEKKENVIKQSDILLQLKLNRKVKIIPFKNYLTYLSNCKIYIQTSAWEGMPNILIEALVLKKKIVSTNCLHGPKEILCNGKYGYLCNVGDVNEISRGIKKKLNEKKINIPDNFINNFSIKIAANKYYKILK